MYSGNTKTTNELTASNKQIRQTTGEHLEVFQVWHNLCSELTSMLSFMLRFSFIFRYFKVFQVNIIVYILLILSVDNKYINNLFKEAIDQYIQDTRQVFQVWHNLCSELTSM
jgi:hypothetical protein